MGEGGSIGQIWKPGQSFKIFCHSNNPTKTKNYPEYYQSLIDYVNLFIFVVCKKSGCGFTGHFFLSCPPQRHHMMPRAKKSKRRMVAMLPLPRAPFYSIWEAVAVLK